LGYITSLTGKILDIDLSNQNWHSWVEKESLHRKFLSARGLSQYYLSQLLKPQNFPLDPKNYVIFGSGLLVGTRTPGATRTNIDSKNLFSNGVGSTNGGEYFAVAMKYAGYGHIRITGKSARPVYLLIDGGQVSLEDAQEIWGKITSQTVDYIRNKHGNNFHIACIGPAGENLVRGACVMINKSRAAAKCGMGAILGSKNLKAIAVRGNQIPKILNEVKFNNLVDRARKKVLNSGTTLRMSRWGAKSAVKAKNKVGSVPYRHFQDGYVDNLDGLDENAFSKYEVKRFGIENCPIICRQIYRVSDGPYAGLEGEAVESNTVQDFGLKLDIRETTAIIKAHVLCNDYGIDIDTVAETIAWAYECYDRGLIDRGDTDGLELNWGNHRSLMELIDWIAYRRGFGDILAEGVVRASKMIGRGTQKYAMAMKGQDLYEDMRMPKGWALGVALSTRGGGHCSGAPIVEFAAGKSSAEVLTTELAKKLYGVETAMDPAAYEGKAKLVAYHERLHAVLNSLGICLFNSIWEGYELLDENDIAQLVNAATGWDLDGFGLLNIGERIHNLERMFNYKHAGLDRKDDYPPARFMEEKIKSGPYQGEYMDKQQFDRMLDENYRIHGWSSQGIPKARTLLKLGLKDIVN
jgi:aldehyde:ferredoxin oxidoreductase